MVTNYGESDVVINSQRVGRVRVAGISAASALNPRLRVVTKWSLTHALSHAVGEEAKRYYITDVRGELRMEETGPAIGLLSQHGGGHPSRSEAFATEALLPLILDLDWFRFERIEEKRSGGPLSLWIELWPRVEGLGEPPFVTVSFPIRVPREDWLALVAAISNAPVELLEIRYYLSHAAHFRTSVAELRRAREAIDRGDTTTAVMYARKAILLMEAAVKADGSASLEQALEVRVGKKHAKLYQSIAAQLKNMGNIPAHESGSRDYSRVEALFAVRSVELLLELVGSFLGA